MAESLFRHQATKRLIADDLCKKVIGGTAIANDFWEPSGQSGFVYFIGNPILAISYLSGFIVRRLSMNGNINGISSVSPVAIIIIRALKGVINTISYIPNATLYTLNILSGNVISQSYLWSFLDIIKETIPGGTLMINKVIKKIGLSVLRFR